MIFFGLIGSRNAVLFLFIILLSLVSEGYLVWLVGSFSFANGFMLDVESETFLLDALVAFLLASSARLAWLWTCTNLGFFAGAQVGILAYERILDIKSNPEVVEISSQLLGRQSEDASLIFIGLCWILHSIFLIVVVLGMFLFQASYEAVIGACFLALVFIFLFLSIRSFLSYFSRESKELINRVDRTFLVTSKANFSHQINGMHLSFRKYYKGKLLRLRFLQGITVSLSQSSKSFLEILGVIGVAILFILIEREIVSNAFHHLPLVMVASLRIFPALQRIFSSISLLSGKKYVMEHIEKIQSERC